MEKKQSFLVAAGVFVLMAMAGLIVVFGVSDPVVYEDYEVFEDNSAVILTPQVWESINPSQADNIEGYSLKWIKPSVFSGELIEGSGTVYGYQNDKQPHLWIVNMESTLCQSKEGTERGVPVELRQCRWELTENGNGFLVDWSHSEENWTANELSADCVNSMARSTGYSLKLDINRTLAAGDRYSMTARLEFDTKGERTQPEALALDWNWSCNFSTAAGGAA